MDFTVTNRIKSGIFLLLYLAVGAYRAALSVHKEVKFDVVHHVTWVSISSQVSWVTLGYLSISGGCGGESAPWSLRRGYSLRQWLQDIVRDVANVFVKSIL